MPDYDDEEERELRRARARITGAVDQAAAGLEGSGAMIAALYRGMIAGGMPADAASSVCRAYVREVVRTQRPEESTA